MDGSLTSGLGEEDREHPPSSLYSASKDHPHFHAAERHFQVSPNAQDNPVAQSPVESSTQIHPSRKSPLGEKPLLVQPDAQAHPVAHCTVSSPTQAPPVRESPIEHHRAVHIGEDGPKDHLRNGVRQSLPHSRMHPSKSASENRKSKQAVPEVLPTSTTSSSKKSSKKSSKHSLTHKISPRLDGDSQWTNLSKESSVPNWSAIPNEVFNQQEPVTYKEAATCTYTATSISTESPIPKDSPIRRPTAEPSVSMPKVSPTHKASPTHRAGSQGATPTKERHARRTINANSTRTVDMENEVTGRTLEEGKERMMKMMENGARMRAIMEQEIQRLSLQKREVVMKDRVVEPESWKRDVQKQIEEELERRVREALETPPLERMRRNRHKAKLKQIQREQTSISIEECDNYAQTLPNLRNLHHHRLWDLPETPYSFSDSQNRQNRFSRLTGTLQPGNYHDSDTEDDSGDSTTAANRNQNSTSSSWRLHPLHHHNDNRTGENGILATTAREHDSLSEESDMDSEQARTVVEVRRKMFRQYTAEGFKSALRKGKSHLKKLGSGKYEDKNGVVLTIDGPFWPPECGPLYPKPEHQNFIPQEKELLADAVPDNSRTVHSQRTKWFRPFEATSINIFDSERTSKGTIPHSVPEGCPPSLVFESRFESGNLRQARRVGQFEYDLILKTDLYTARHTQWFYFRVQKMIPGITFKFNIVNLLKKDSLYNHGMRPLMYSEREAAKSNLGWHRIGHHINYSRSNGFHRNPLLHVDMVYYTLSWQMEFAYENDTCYFAHCYPYTFTDLREHINHLLSDPERRRCTKREVMCESRAGNSCFLLTVTNFTERQTANKRGVVVTARVHPGETNASWVMKGFLDYITGSDPVAKDLRKAFVFKIVPMLNPDGVIVGNYRCSLTGRDLNRNFRHPKKESFPTVWHTKEMLEDFSKETEVLVYCDLHGHSRKHNVFIYGCDKNGKEIDAASFLYQRLFPFLMAREAPDKFSFHGCKFHVKRCKEATGRVVMWRELGINNSFTMEATFCGSKDIRREDTPRHFNLSDFEDLGRHFCEALMVYHKAQENKSLHSELILELTREITHQVLESRGLLPQQLLAPYGKGAQDNKNKDGTTNSQAKLSSSEITDKVASLNDPSAPSKVPPSGHDKPGQLVRSLEGRLETMRMIDALSSETIQGCIGILQDLHAMKDFTESDSSDSDSASESEAPPAPEADDDKQDEKKKKKKKGKHRSKSMPASRTYSLPDHGASFVTRGDGKLHLKLALKAQEHHHQGLPSIPTADHPTAAAPPKSYQIYALQGDLSPGSLGPDVRPFRMACHGKSRVSSYDERFAQLCRRGRDESGPTLYRLVEPRTIEMPLEAEQRISNLEEPDTSYGFLPSIGALYYDEELNPAECDKTVQMIKKYPPFVNRYIGRSNNGIPMFAQERLEERASKRMETVKKLEQERLERQATAFQTQLSEEDAHFLALSRHLQLQEKEEGQYKMDTPTLTVQCNIPGTPGYPLQVNFRQGYTHRNSTMIKGHPLSLDQIGDGLQEADGKQDTPRVTSSRQSPRKLEPMSDARVPGVSLHSNLDGKRMGVGQVQGAFVDQISSDLRNRVSEGDFVDQRDQRELADHKSNIAVSPGKLDDVEAGKSMGAPNQAQGLNRGRTVTEMDLRMFRADMDENWPDSSRTSSNRTPSGRGDQSRMQSAKSYSVTNPWLGARNLHNGSRFNLPTGGSFGHAPPPLRSLRHRHPSAVKKNHMDLIEQQYGRFLSGVDPKRAPSTAAKYLQSLAKSVIDGASTSQPQTVTKQVKKK
ncbi:uncharacterized protein LOC110987635 isoform X3 [Acanthaster planci]|uniref:Uncharacterized protein LOC110987635 isoform X3 n=1 Tax=Acanthaster planci TaxID=133434 RepID=A0A8B7ZL59_ACAPL|nr:uncharacterized protein LOC110987635 isoform X3 [Acanthaster planci]